MEHIDEIFGTPINDLPKTSTGSTNGWKIGLGLGLIVIVGVGVYYYIENKQKKVGDES